MGNCGHRGLGDSGGPLARAAPIEGIGSGKGSLTPNHSRDAYTGSRFGKRWLQAGWVEIVPSARRDIAQAECRSGARVSPATTVGPAARSALWPPDSGGNN